MGVLMHFLQMSGRQLSVAFGGAQARVAEQVLDAAQVRTRTEQMSTEGMTQCVRMNIIGQSCSHRD